MSNIHREFLSQQCFVMFKNVWKNGLGILTSEKELPASPVYFIYIYMKLLSYTNLNKIILKQYVPKHQDCVLFSYMHA